MQTSQNIDSNGVSLLNCAVVALQREVATNQLKDYSDLELREAYKNILFLHREIGKKISIESCNREFQESYKTPNR